MATEFEYIPCPKCKALMAVVTGEKASTRCGRCWEGVVDSAEPDKGGGSQ